MHYQCPGGRGNAEFQAGLWDPNTVWVDESSRDGGWFGHGSLAVPRCGKFHIVAGGLKWWLGGVGIYRYCEV